MPVTHADPPIAAEIRPVPLKPGPEWGSFEQFRVAGSGGVETVTVGQVGTLRTKTGVFRVIRDEDFQTLVGLASDVMRMKSGLTTLIRAIEVVREHPTSASALDLLRHIATQYGDEPGAAATFIERVAAAPVPRNDEVIIDPAELQKRVAKR